MKYFVIKKKDLKYASINKILKPEDLLHFIVFLEKIDMARKQRGKEKLDCVCIEKGWPGYEMLEAKTKD